MSVYLIGFFVSTLIIKATNVIKKNQRFVLILVALLIPCLIAGLRDLNVKEEDFAVLATNALKDACGFTNPIQATHEEIVAIYRAAM